MVMRLRIDREGVRKLVEEREDGVVKVCDGVVIFSWFCLVVCHCPFPGTGSLAPCYRFPSYVKAEQ